MTDGVPLELADGVPNGSPSGLPDGLLDGSVADLPDERADGLPDGWRCYGRAGIGAWD